MKTKIVGDTLEQIKATHKKQRVALGFVCLLLYPISLLFGLFNLGANPEGWFHSISAMYYATSKPVMIGALTLASFYFLTYTGYDWRDRIINIVSGVAAILIILFPNKGVDGVFNFTGHENVCAIIHNVSALLFFLPFLVNCFYLFCLGDKKEPGKIKKNVCFIIAGCGIVGAAVLFIFTAIGRVPGWGTGLAECIALTFYSFAWFIKSEILKV